MRLSLFLAGVCSALSFSFGANAFANSNLVILIPGAGSSGPDIYVQNIPTPFGHRYFGGILDALKNENIPAMVCPKTPDQDVRTLEEREEDCAQDILEYEKANSTQTARNIILFGHSMGGNIGRLLAHDPRVNQNIKGVVTISTPQLGTPIANYVIEHDSKYTDALGVIIKFIGFDPGRTRYLPELKVGQFPDISDDSNVSYFSISDSFEKLGDPIDTLRLILKSEIEKRGLNQTSFGSRNDGIVPEYSMLHGKYLGHVTATHFETSCSDTYRYSAGCKRTLNVLIPLFKSLL